MSVSFEEAFLSFCNSTKMNSKTATDKTIKKICQESKLNTKAMDANSVDIAFRKFVGNTKKDVNFTEFTSFLQKHLAAEYGKSKKMDEAAAFEAMKASIIENCPASKGPKGPKVDKTTERLTDTSKYTGSHKERFDGSGKGKGLEGRVDKDKHAEQGYVGNYKGSGSYDKAH